MPEPQQVNLRCSSGSTFSEAITLNNTDGTPQDLSTMTAEFVVRPATTDTTQPPLIKVSSQQATSQGYLTISGNTITVVLSPTATALLGFSAKPWALWLNPDTASAFERVSGTLFSQLVATP